MPFCREQKWQGPGTWRGSVGAKDTWSPEHSLSAICVGESGHKEPQRGPSVTERMTPSPGERLLCCGGSHTWVASPSPGQRCEELPGPLLYAEEKEFVQAQGSRSDSGLVCLSQEVPLLITELCQLAGGPTGQPTAPVYSRWWG